MQNWCLLRSTEHFPGLDFLSLLKLGRQILDFRVPDFRRVAKS